MLAALAAWENVGAETARIGRQAIRPTVAATTSPNQCPLEGVSIAVNMVGGTKFALLLRFRQSAGRITSTE